MRPRPISEEEFTAMRKRVRERCGGNTLISGRDKAAEAIRRTPSSGVRAKAGSNPAPSPTYRSKWEAAFASKLELEKQAGIIKAYKYEGISLQLSKGQYHRPDFLIWHLDGSIEMAQVKGWHKNMRAGIKGLKWAAQLHPWFTWTVKRWTGTGWDSHYMEV